MRQRIGSEPISRYMPRQLCLSILLSLIAAPAVAVRSEQLIGGWKSDNGRAYSELHFRPDHSFTLFSRMSTANQELAVADMAEQFGTWRVEGDRLKLNSMRRWSKERSRISIRFEIANGVLRLQDAYDSKKTDIYRRLKSPSCPSQWAVSNRSFSENDLLGRWRCHYRTHDCEFLFEPRHKVSAYAEGVRVLEGSWQVKGSGLTIKPRVKRPDGTNARISWTIVRSSTGCLRISNGSSMAYTLERHN